MFLIHFPFLLPIETVRSCEGEEKNASMFVYVLRLFLFTYLSPDSHSCLLKCSLYFSFPHSLPIDIICVCRRGRGKDGFCVFSLYIFHLLKLILGTVAKSIPSPGCVGKPDQGLFCGNVRRFLYFLLPIEIVRAVREIKCMSVLFCFFYLNQYFYHRFFLC